MYSVCIATSCSSKKLKSLRLTLRAVFAQSLKPSEVIVALNNDTSDDCKNALQVIFPELIFVQATAMQNNVSYARNLAAGLCTQKHILFLDDDTVINGSNAMREILSQQLSFDFACGAKRYWTSNDWAKSISELEPIEYITNLLSHLSFEPVNLDRKTGKQKLSNFSFIGNFGLIKTNVFEKAGGFDENFSGWGYEDTDLIQTLLHQQARFLLLNRINISCFHLSHHADKSNVKSNIDLYTAKKLKRGKGYKINHLFGVFEHDGYELGYDISDRNVVLL